MFISDFINYITAPKYLGVVSSISKSTSTIIVSGSIITELSHGTKIRIQGASNLIDIIYTVDTVNYTAPNTVIKVVESIPSEITITSNMTVTLYKGIETTTTTINLKTDNKDIALDNINTPVDSNISIKDNMVKLTYDENNSTVSCKTYGYILTPYEEQTQQEYKSVFTKLGTNNLSTYFRGMNELSTTLFSGLSVTDIDSHRTDFYNKMQDATILDAGSFVIIPPDDQSSVLVKGIQYFIDNYDIAQVIKIKYLSYGESLTVTNPDGNSEIITCGRACTFSF